MISAFAQFKAKMTTVFLFAALLVILTFLIYSANAQTTSSLLDTRLADIEKAINAKEENWKSLKNILVEIKKTRANVKNCDIESPLRLLYGHVALATGENTTAVEQFYCVADSNGSRSLRDWQAWAQKLVDRNPNSASALYFLGDAFARNGKLEQAKNEFDQALKINPQHVLALNARGVVKRLLFESDSSKFSKYESEAVGDLSRVNQISPQFADAWANRGIIGLRDESYLTRATGFFDKALAFDPAYWLALNGKAVSLGATGKYAEFQRDLGIITHKAPSTPFASFNSSLSVAGDMSIASNRGVMNAMQDIKNLIRDFKQGVRGGVFMYLKEGENLIVTNGSRRSVSTWFALNYPPTQLLPSEVK